MEGDIDVGYIPGKLEELRKQIEIEKLKDNRDDLLIKRLELDFERQKMCTKEHFRVNRGIDIL